MPGNAEKLRLAFRREMLDLRSLLRSGLKTTTGLTRERLAEAVFLSAYTELEVTIEALFHLAAAGRITTGGISPVFAARDSEAIRRVIEPTTRSHVDWLPIDATLERAELFLNDGRPFSHLKRRSAHKSRLRDAQVIRNAIAHRSGRAQTKFRKMTGSHFVTPGAFLVSVANGTSTCEAHLNAFVRVIHGLCANTHHEVEMLLGPNDPFKSGQKPGAGAFTCRGCGRTYVLTQGDPLVCPACDPPCASCGRPMSAAAVFDD